MLRVYVGLLCFYETIIQKNTADLYVFNSIVENGGFNTEITENIYNNLINRVMLDPEIFLLSQSNLQKPS